MAEKIVFKLALAASLSPTRTRLTWIKRRARCIALAFQVNRSEAVVSAAGDWHLFNPNATH